MNTKRLFVGVAAATAAVGIGTGAAFAFWGASGSGQGAGAATVAQSLTVTPVTPSGANASIFPGGPGGAVYFTVTNPNPYPVEITGVTWGTPTSTNTSTCASSNLSLDNSAPTSGLTITVPADTTAVTSPLFSIANVIDLVTGGNGCQGVAFDVTMSVTGAQQA